MPDDSPIEQLTLERVLEAVKAMREQLDRVEGRLEALTAQVGEIAKDAASARGGQRVKGRQR